VLREEEEQLVAAGVEAGPGNQHRAAQRPRAVVELIRCRVALRRHALAALTAAVELVAVQAVIALVERGAAMKILRAAAGDDGDRRARAAAVLGLEIRSLDAHLGDRVARRGCGGAAARLRGPRGGA